jgi:hypothetical protein
MYTLTAQLVILPAAGAVDWMYTLTAQLVILPAAGAVDWMYTLTAQLVILNEVKDLDFRDSSAYGLRMTKQKKYTCLFNPSPQSSYAHHALTLEYFLKSVHEILHLSSRYVPLSQASGQNVRRRGQAELRHA